ncbi:PucR family transcriptional regulator [Feifania hominis]|uniref:Helix-turn-helix domain-containing protein n=1 Tax=Feifania hominis TaxID=2763660 RepID=A0A926HU57_9FIRM|nr:helix-turn-helix domain-containing protein [Feifania hominis]MBC8535595.1 helix-turn-helix domain-containing protein [Feifania hominis]
MANRLFQSLILQLKDSVDRIIGIIDESGTIIACSELSLIGEERKNARSELSYFNKAITMDGYTYKPLNFHSKLDYAVFVEGTDIMADSYVSILTVSLNSIKQLYDEKYDVSNFVKNVILDNILPGDIYYKAKELHFTGDILDNILPGDIYYKAKELHFTGDIPRIVYVIRCDSISEVSLFDSVQELFPDKNKDFVVSISEYDVAVVKELVNIQDVKEIEKCAKATIDYLAEEKGRKCQIGVGSPVTSLKDLARSFKEAQTALEIGKVFEKEKNIVSYKNLGIGRLIYQLPTTLCEMFLSEVFKQGSIDSLDQETLLTISKFFENNLNVSETARKLFVHRNTLVYRLEKIKKLTGLDIREFDNAIIFKVALMVNRYLSSNPNRF